LLIELDGIEAGLDDEAQKVTSICMEYGARNCRYARDEAERKKLWAARKGAFGAIGRITPDSMIQDAVVPRSRLPEVLGAAYEIATKYQLRIANVFHAGDGNLHPLICFDSRSREEVQRVKEAGRELMEVCVRAGGTITGEHGVGFDKRELLPLVFSDADMDAMLRVRAAFDPLGLCNPGKIIPLLRGCGEAKAIATEVPERSEPHSFRQQQSRTEDSNIDHARIEQPRLEQVRKRGLPPLFTSLARIVSDANVLSHNDTAIVWPASADEISEILKLASLEGWTGRPAGGIRWLKSPGSVTVSTCRLDQIVEHEPADLIAVAQ